MIIALDIDGTIINSNSLVYKILNSYPKKFLGINKKSSTLFDTNKEYKKTPLNKLFRFLNPEYYYSINDAINVINYFAKNNVVILLSSRPANLKCIQYLTNQNISDSKICSDLVFLGVKNKEHFCRENNVDVLIDNNILTCIAVANHSNTKSICFNPNIEQSSSGVMIVRTWLQLGTELNSLSKQATKTKASKQEIIDTLKNRYANEQQIERE